MRYRGHVQNGTVVLDDPAVLPEGVKVEVIVNADEGTRQPNMRRTLYEVLEPFIGMANGLPPDGSQNLDHYLYGTPKQ